jgi:hypothetical protein
MAKFRDKRLGQPWWILYSAPFTTPTRPGGIV